MPTPLPHVIQAPSIKLDKDDLTNRSQYSNAVDWIAARVLASFGLVTFFAHAICSLRLSLRTSGDFDHRTKVVKELIAAEDALMAAAKQYDDAAQAVRESFKKRGKK